MNHVRMKRPEFTIMDAMDVTGLSDKPRPRGPIALPPTEREKAVFRRIEKDCPIRVETLQNCSLRDFENYSRDIICGKRKLLGGRR